MNKYINHVSDYEQSIVFCLIRDIETVYNSYEEGNMLLINAINQVSSIYHYLKGYLFGLGITRIEKVFFKGDKKCEYLSFYANSAKKVKYSLCICLEPDNFAVKYTRKGV